MGTALFFLFDPAKEQKTGRPGPPLSSKRAGNTAAVPPAEHLIISVVACIGMALGITLSVLLDNYEETRSAKAAETAVKGELNYEDARCER